MRRRFLLPAAAAALMLAPDGATASTIPVTTLEDVVDSADGRCSLREAILAVNAPPGSGDCVRADANANTIQLGAGTYTLTRAGAHEDAASTGDLDLLAGTVSLTLVGSGAGQTTISAAGLGDRLVDVRPGAPSLAIQNMTLTGGRAPSGTPGNPGAAGGLGEAGGAIRSAGPLALTDVVVTDNRAGNGGAGGDGPDGGGMSGGGPGGPAGAGGTGGAGGAIDITGALTLTRVVLSFNAAGKGGLGGTGGTDSTVAYASGNGGLGGTGGAIAVSGGPLVISGGRFDGNHAGDGGDGGHGENGPSGAHPSAAGAQGGTGGRAGAVFMPGTATVTASTFVANAAGTGGAGGNGGANSDDVAGAGGAGGAGGTTGALLSQFGDATLLNLTLVGNRAGNGGAGGVGGSNLSANGAVGGAGGAGGMAGALRRQGSGTAYLTHGTVTGNAPGFGGAGGQGGAGSTTNAAPGASGSAGVTGGVSDGSVTNASFTQITNSIVASNTSANCAGGFADGGRNIAFGDGTCTGFTVADPALGPLQDNGGPGETRALLAGSPAIDQVPAEGAGCPATDARGGTARRGPLRHRRVRGVAAGMPAGRGDRRCRRADPDRAHLHQPGGGALHLRHRGRPRARHAVGPRRADGHRHVHGGRRLRGG